MKDYTNIFNKFVTLYCNTQDPEVKKKAWEKIYYIVYKNMKYVYFAYLTKNHIYRNDNFDIVDNCSIRLVDRIFRWSNKGKAYTVKKLYTVLYFEVVYALRNEKQQFIDSVTSYDEFVENTMRKEEMEDEMDIESLCEN